MGTSKSKLLDECDRPKLSTYLGWLRWPTQINKNALRSTGPKWTVLHREAYQNILTHKDVHDLTPRQLDVRDEFGRSPLWWASHQCNSDNAKVLLYWGADPKQKDDYGKNLFHAVAIGAASNECIKMAKLLTNHGVDYNEADADGKSSLDFLREETSPHDCTKETVRQRLLDLLNKN